jgi:putative transposase
MPTARAFVCVTGIIDWFTRRVLTWRLPITMEAEFCIEAFEKAVARYDKPEIFNTDHGAQFTSAAFTSVYIKAGVAISMDGKGAWRDKVTGPEYARI